MFRRRAAVPALAVSSLLVFGTHCGEHEIHFMETVNGSNGGNLASGGASSGGANASGGASGGLRGFGGNIGAGGKTSNRGGTPNSESGGRSFGGSSAGGRFNGVGGFQGSGGGRPEVCYRRCPDGFCPYCSPGSGNSNGSGNSTGDGGAAGSDGTSGGVTGGGRGGYPNNGDSCRADLRCDPECNVCVECLVAADCAGRGQGPFKCDPLTLTCIQLCNENKDCQWPTPVCNNFRHVCVQCIEEQDCARGSHCTDNVCVQ